MTPSKDMMADFREVMAANVRRLADRSGVYIAAMSDRDREIVLGRALDIAFANWGDDRIDGLAVFWDCCLRDALMTARVWPRRVVGGWVYDYTPRILKSIKPLGA